MISSLITSICDGNLEKLKEIPKNKITEDISKQLLSLMEEQIKKINEIINCDGEGNELKYLLCYYITKKKDIEKCILYLKKIK
jgi:hypothetical protein